MNFTFGVDYYPEHWPRERWETDAAMMQDMGLDVVRMAEFSWFKMEPRENEFCFDWLDDAISVLADHGIRTILGTPTAAPPAWVIESDPTIEPVDQLGRRRHFGGRHHDCQSHPGYRAHIKRFVTAFARRFADNPNVIGWQVDNELGNSHDDLCYCEHCEERFRQWLERKFGSIDVLNEKWGTAFWSQGYQSFAQVHAPRLTVTGTNPSQMLDWKRFHSDLIVEFHQFQADILRAAAPDKFITHNMMGFTPTVNYHDLGKALDFASQDQYPGGHFWEKQNELRDDRLAADLDVIRSVKDAPFAVMEQQSAITGWEVLGRAPKPGQLALWALQGVAHGADAIVFFRWRSCAVGTEQYWHGLLPHSGMPGRNYRELKAFVSAMKPLMPSIRGGIPKRELGILFSYEQEYAIAIQPHHPQMTYLDHLLTYYRAFHRRNVPIDFVTIERELAAYKALIVPLHYLNKPEWTAKLLAYAENGGTLVLTMRAGVKDEWNNCLTDAPLPVGFSDAAGLVVDEYDCLREVDNEVEWDGERYPCHKWCDILHLTNAQPLARYTKEFYAGSPAVTRREYGRGSIYYVGTEMGDGLAARFATELIGKAGLMNLGETNVGVELTERVAADGGYLFALNHTGEEQPLSLGDEWRLVTGEDGATLSPYEGRVYRRA